MRKKIKQLDALWSSAIRKKWNNKCAYCGKRSYLNAHHIFSRSNKSTRWDIDNGILLCSGHHTLNSTFSAHKTPTEFTYWLEELLGKQYLEDLELSAHSIFKKNTEKLLEAELTSFLKGKTPKKLKMAMP